VIPNPPAEFSPFRDHKIGAMGIPESAQLRTHHLPARLADDITDEKDFQ